MFPASASRKKEVEVPAAGVCRLARLLEALERELADRLQHRVPLAVEADEALLDERLQPVEVTVRNLLGRLQRAAAGEDGQPPKELLLLRREELVAPADRR